MRTCCDDRFESGMSQPMAGEPFVAQAEHGQRLVEAFSDARGRTRVVGVQAASQVLQQSFRRRRWRSCRRG